MCRECILDCATNNQYSAAYLLRESFDDYGENVKFKNNP